MKNRIVVIPLFLACAVLAPAQKITAVRFGKLWDGEKVIDRATVVIENGRIRNVNGGDLAPGQAVTLERTAETSDRGCAPARDEAASTVSKAASTKLRQGEEPVWQLDSEKGRG